MRIPVVIVLLFSLSFGFSQNDFSEDESVLSFYADVMVNASKASHRQKACQDFNELFTAVLNKEGSFDYPFDSIEWISKLESKDSTFRLFTWQLTLDVDKVEYFGLFQPANQAVIPLRDAVKSDPDIDYEVLAPDSWHGHLYYELLEYEIEDKKNYMLFGGRVIDEFTYQKIAEPLVWDGEQLRFGEEVFFKESRHGATRFRIQYFSRSKATLKYDQEIDLIVFDHIIPVINPYESQGTILVPEGTFEGFELKGRKWKYVEKIFNERYEQAPVPEPILRERKKDLFGK